MAIQTPSSVPQERPGRIQSLGPGKYAKRLEAYRGARRDFVNRLFKGMLGQSVNPFQLGPSNPNQLQNPANPRNKQMGMAEAAQRRSQNRSRNAGNVNG